MDFCFKNYFCPRFCKDAGGGGIGKWRWRSLMKFQMLDTNWKCRTLELWGTANLRYFLED